jgi:hypothetical protein
VETPAKIGFRNFPGQPCAFAGNDKARDPLAKRELLIASFAEGQEFGRNRLLLNGNSERRPREWRNPWLRRLARA